MLLTELLEAQEAVGRLLVPFLTHEERLQLLALSRAMIYSSFRREVFATSKWAIPTARWLASQVLQSFTMKDEVTSVVISRGEWQQPLLSQFSELFEVKVESEAKTKLLHWHFPSKQITLLDLSDAKIGDMAPLAFFLELEKLRLPDSIALENLHALEALQSLRSLDVGFCSNEGGVRDLWFLEKLPELTEFTLEGFDGDLAPLVHLKKLERLNVMGTEITDLKPLQASADTLSALEVSENAVSVMGFAAYKVANFFKSFVNLEELGLVETSLLDNVFLSPLASLVNLTCLQLGEEEYNDLSPLASLTELKVLRIMTEPGTDWSPIANMKKLESLDQLASVVSTDSNVAKILASLPNLSELSSPVALSPKYPLPQVRSLTLSSHSKSALAAEDVALPLDKVCPNVVTLRLQGCFDLARLGLSNLKKLDDLIMVTLETARVAMPLAHRIDYTPIAELHSLPKLAISNVCEAKDIQFLASLVNIRELNMMRLSISDISVLANMSHLEKLVLSGPSIVDISPLGDLKNLREVHLDGTSVKDVSCLRGLPQLAKLSLPESADCTPLLDDYGTSLPSICKFNHHRHKCNLLEDVGTNLPELESIVIDATPGIIDRCPVPPASSEYFKRVRHHY